MCICVCVCVYACVYVCGCVQAATKKFRRTYRANRFPRLKKRLN